MTPAVDPREALLAAAERLFAEHGPDGVSLRDVARAAGQRNNAAVHYHFGGRDHLLAEVFRRRMTEINAVRAARLETSGRAGEEWEVAELVALVLEPLADHLHRAGPGSTYVQFMVRTMAEVDFAGSSLVAANDIQYLIGRWLRQRLSHLEAGVAHRRIQLGLGMAVAALADFERRWNLGRVSDQQLPETVAEIIAMTAAGLCAPAPHPDRRGSGRGG